MTVKGGIQPEVTPAKKRKFFQVFSVSGVVGTACKASGISRQTIYRLIKDDKIFAERFAECREMAADVLEQAAFKRAVTGVVVSQEPLVYNGVVVGERVTRKYSDTLLALLLKANRPEKFKDTLELNVGWRQEAKAAGVNPDEYLQSMIDQARLLLEQSSEMIDVTASMDLEMDNEDATRKTSASPTDS
jgi:hypothetical protein